MNRHTRCTSTASALLGAGTLALTLMSTPVHAEDWRFVLTPYGWGADIGIDAELDGRTVVDETIAVSDLIRDIDWLFQMRFEATRGRVGVLIDVFDVTMSMEKYGVALPQNVGTGDFETAVGMTIADVAATFTPSGNGGGVGFIAGARILNDRSDVDARFSLNGGGAASARYESNETLVDGLVGIRFRTRLAKSWAIESAADVSSGGTDWTWSVNPSVSYVFGERSRFAINAGYRRLDVDYRDEGGMDTRISLSGPLLGFRTSF